jgi:hypothetical protein
MNWTVLTFGKHKGKTLPQIMFSDPDWFFWAWENNAFKGELLRQAQEIYMKATAIRVPQDDGEKRIVEYIVDQGTGKFGTISIVRSDLENYGPMSKYRVTEVIDMRIPRQYARHDKFGYKNFLSAMKGILFGDPSHRMNEKRCAEFFEDDRNFVLTSQCGRAQPENPERPCAKRSGAGEEYGLLTI